MFRLMVMGLIFTAVACATPPDYQEQLSAYYGDQPDYSWAQVEVQRFMVNHLKDAESARYEWGDIRKGYLRAGSDVEYGYILEARVNAKNSFGAYVGFRNYEFLFRDGDIVTAYGETSSGGRIRKTRLK